MVGAAPIRLAVVIVVPLLEVLLPLKSRVPSPVFAYVSVLVNPPPTVMEVPCAGAKLMMPVPE